MLRAPAPRARPSANSSSQSASCRIVGNGHEFRPSANVCSSLPGNSSGGERSLRSECGRDQLARRVHRSFADDGGRPARLLRSAPPCAIRTASRHRCSLTRESAQISSVPISVNRTPSLTGIGPLFRLLAEPDHGLKRSMQVQIRIAGIEFDYFPELVFGANQRTVQPEGDRLCWRPVAGLRGRPPARSLLRFRAAPGRRSGSCRRAIRCRCSKRAASPPRTSRPAPVERT